MLDFNFTLVIDWGEGTPQTYAYPASSTLDSESHQYLDDNPSGTNSDTYTIGVTITDDDGGTGTTNTTITVNNLAPDIYEITAPIEPLQIGTEITASANFTDIGTNDTHTAIWAWGDNTTSAGDVDEGTGIITGNHTYTIPGVYAITLTATDDDMSSCEAAFSYVVIYNPAAGFVTGGGWINSPEGAYPDNSSITGKANLGFNIRYPEGESTPSGQIQFNFKEADLKLHSTGYEWLVINGARAIFKGEGTINGEGIYKFQVTVIDAEADLNDDFDEDCIRIKIWEVVGGNEVVIYDNTLGNNNDSALTELGGGSIVIHVD